MDRPWRRAARWLLFLMPFVVLTYGAAAGITEMRSDIGAIVFGWERFIPFMPWTFLPYWSVLLLYGVSLFVCGTERELTTHVRRLLTAQVIAVLCFLLLPLRFSFPRPPLVTGTGLFSDILALFDKPFNQAPSLQIAVLVILWTLFARHVSDAWRSLVYGWMSLCATSVLTTYQHHFIDVPSGALLGFVCLWLWPAEADCPLAGAGLTSDPVRRRIAWCYLGGAGVLCLPPLMFGGFTLWLLWPALSLALVAANYAIFGAAGFQKEADGEMSIAVRWLLAPYIGGVRLRSWLAARGDRASVPIQDDVFLGRVPAVRRAFASIIDLSAELPGLYQTPAWRAVPILDRTSPSSDELRTLAGLIEHTRQAGPVLVCSALGCERAAAAVVAWLAITGREETIEAALQKVRRVRPRVAFSDRTRAAVAGAAIGAGRA